MEAHFDVFRVVIEVWKGDIEVRNEQAVFFRLGRRRIESYRVTQAAVISSQK